MNDSDPPDDDPVDVVEPGSPTLESTLFVVLGVLSTIAVILQLAGLA